MKADLDRLMAARELKALIVTGGEGANTYRDYLSNGARISGGTIIKVHGKAPVIIANPMETEEAASSGLEVLSWYELGWAELLKNAKGNSTQAEIELWGRYFERFEISPGKVGIYGTGDLHVYMEIMRLLAKAYPSYQFVGELGMSIFDEAYVTKDTDELARIKSVSERTSATLQATWDYISGHRADGDTVMKADGSPLTIGDVKRFVRRTLLDHDLEDTNMIFAQGRDAGFPHSRGEAHTPLRLGQSIVFDLFPREIGGGYHHDSTRTWSIGYATPEVEQAYHQVMEAFEIASDTFGVGKPTSVMQEAVLDYFEGVGHPTGRSHPGTNEGYVHSLGHGVGLNIHERPKMSHLSRDERFQIGNVVSIEPGLYYPERGFGVRVEDLCYVNEHGQLIGMTSFHKDLVLPLKG